MEKCFFYRYTTIGTTVIVYLQYLLHIKHNNSFRNTIRANRYRVLTDARARGGLPQSMGCKPHFTISRYSYFNEMSVTEIYIV